MVSIRRLLLIGFSTLLVTGALGVSSAAASGPVSNLAHIGKDRSTTTNWSGYVVFNSTFSHVRGDWTVPTVDCSSMKGQQTAIATNFVGLDGYSSGTVEQSGTDADCIGKTPFYIAWFEFYPERAFFQDQSTYPVNPGDHMHADATVSGGNVTVTLQNVTQNWTLTPAPSRPSTGFDFSSAEWILEAPAQKLANFGSVSIFNAHATDATHNDAAISAFPSQDAITMVSKSGRTTRATPSALGGGGDNFTVTFNHQ